MPNITLRFLIFILPLLASVNHPAIAVDSCSVNTNRSHIYYVSLDGHDYKGKGTESKPWRHIDFAVFKAKDDSLIIVKPGVYSESVKISKTFNKGLTIKAEFPYQSKLISNRRVLALVKNAANITISGFEISHLDSKARPVVVHIDAWGKDKVRHINIINNIIHDSFNNDLLKINFGAEHIKVACNMFYNQGNSDEHIDINSSAHVEVTENIFFNDFEKSKRNISKRTSSFIVIKDSNNNDDRFKGARDINVHRNVFFNWQGSHGHGFILVGEDGKDYYEATNINIFNNLLLGNSDISMRSPFGIKGAHNIRIFNNTISGDLPSNAFAIRINKEGNNQTPTNISLSQNIFYDPYGSMGQGQYESSIDFSDSKIYEVGEVIMRNNLVFNKGESLPYSMMDKINPSMDKQLINKDPKLPMVDSVITPIWRANLNRFDDGSLTIEQVFKGLISQYAIPENTDAVSVDSNIEGALTDILNRPRTSPDSVGAYQIVQ